MSLLCFEQLLRHNRASREGFGQAAFVIVNHKHLAQNILLKSLQKPKNRHRKTNLSQYQDVAGGSHKAHSWLSSSYVQLCRISGVPYT